MVKNCLFSWQADESGSDSDGADSTSSSYSSLSDFVTDMVNSEIDGDTPGIAVHVKFSFIYRTDRNTPCMVVLVKLSSI